MDELTAELKNGKSAAENVVRHLRDMGAAKATIPVEVDGVAYVVCAHEATLQDPRDARIAALEGEVLRLNEALNSIKLDRESSDVTWCPQCGPHVIVDDEGLCEMCGATSVGAGAARAVALSEENAALEGRLRETCQILVESVGGLGPCNAEDAARRAAEVVDQLRAQLAAPLRLGRGPTVGEVEAVAAREPDGLWLIRGGEDEDGMAAWSEERLFVEGGIVRVPARWGSMPLKDCIVTDAIPLNASRQPCRVGVKP